MPFVTSSSSNRFEPLTLTSTVPLAGPTTTLCCGTGVGSGVGVGVGVGVCAALDAA